MNESEKNIETCLPESILAEVASVPTDPQFVSLVEESFDPLQQQAVQQAGSDAYNEVVASHQPYTFTSSVRQMKSNLILLLRRFWRFPFGSGTLRSLSDMWAHYITRLQGSETYGIPSRLDQLTDLPSAPLLVADRKIGGADVPDGMSLGRILGDSTLGITEITDDTEGWTMNKEITGFENMRRLALNAITINTRIAANRENLEDVDIPHCKTINAESGKEILWNIKGKEEMEFPELEVVNCGSNSNAFGKFLECKKLSIPNFQYVSRIGNASFLDSFPILEWLYIPKFEGHNGGYGAWPSFCNNNPVLQRVTIGDMQYYSNMGGSTGAMFGSCPNLIRIEFGGSTMQTHNLLLNAWNPTTALSDNLQQFLQNFRSFIVLRLANRKTTTALTLTLSANVYNAVTGADSGWASQHTLAELGITDNDLTDLETELGITSATIYATWLDTYTGANGIHWDINKAN